MADQQNTINNRIIFTGIDEAGKQIQTLKQQLKEIQDARDRAFQSKDKQSKFKDEIVGFEKLSALEKETYKYLQEAESGLTKQVEQRVKAEELALKAKQDSFRKFLIEQDEFSRQQEQAITKQYNAKIAADKAYSNYLQKESSNVDKFDDRDRRKELAQTLSYERKQKNDDRAYNNYLNSLAKQDEAEARSELSHTLQYERRVKQKESADTKAYNSYLNGLATKDEAERKAELSHSLAYEKRLEQQKGITKVEQDELTTLRNMTKELENQKIRYNEQKNPYMAGQTQNQIDALHGLKKVTPEAVVVPDPKPQTYTSLQQQIRATTLEAQRLYVEMNRAVTAEERLVASKGFTEKKAAVKSLSAELDGYNKEMGIAAQKTGLLGSLGDRIRSHFSWILSGSLLAAAFSIPVESVKTLSMIEQAMAGMQQVAPELHNNQQAINEEAKKFIDIAAVYGESVEGIIKAGQSWGRMYKDLNIVNALTHQSAILAVADNFDLATANKAVEAAMFQYGLVAKDTTEAIAFSGRIIDIWTKLAHTAGTTAQDLAKATELTGSVAKQSGMDFEFLSAMIATATRSTQLSGENIGNMMKSVLGSIHSDKATKEIEALGIATKKVGEDGTVELRKSQDVLLDISIQAQGTEKNLEELYKSVSGGELRLAS